MGTVETFAEIRSEALISRVSHEAFFQKCVSPAPFAHFRDDPVARAGSFVHNLTQPPDWFRPGGHDLFRVSRWCHRIFSDEMCLSCFLMLQCHNVQTECPSSYYLAQVIVCIFCRISVTVTISKECECTKHAPWVLA